MNRGLISKSIRESWFPTLMCGMGMMAFEAILTRILPTIQDQFADQWLKVDFIRPFIEGLLGTDIGDMLGPNTFIAMAWVHPVVLAILWAHAITHCTRTPAGEIERGTIDVLLGLPVSRWRVYLCESMVLLTGGAVVICMGLLGNWAAGLGLPAERRADLGRLIVIVANLYCLYMAVGGLAFLVSSLCSRRGRAIGLVFGIVLASFLLNFLIQIWEPAQHLTFLSILDYYQPLLIFRSTDWPIKDMAVLATLGAALWLTGGIIFNRRNIATV